MSEERKGLLCAHGAVLLFGIVGLFAKLVHQPSVVIIFFRVVFSSLSLALFLGIRNKSFKLEALADYVWMIFAGVILAAHWSTFFQSIQTSTVAIGTLTFSTFPLFVTFLEPWLFHEKLQKSSVAGAVLMLVGVMIMIPEFHIANEMTQGVIWGLLSAITYAVLSLINRRFSGRYEAAKISLYEQAVAAVALWPVTMIFKPSVTGNEICVMLILGVVCTALAHSLFIHSLKTVKAQTAGIISGLESVYGILFAFLILKEVPSLREVLGGFLILCVVFWQTVKSDME